MQTEIQQAVGKRVPLYLSLWVQVSVEILLGVVLGRLAPHTALAIKPLGDGFIRLITMVITIVIFCTVVTGIAGMQDIKKVGRVGGKAMLYFGIVSTPALLLGLVAGNLAHPGRGLNVNPATLDVNAVSDYAGAAKAQTTAQFLLHVIPNTLVDPFSRGDILQVVFASVLFGIALAMMRSKAEPLLRIITKWTVQCFARHSGRRKALSRRPHIPLPGSTL